MHMPGTNNAASSQQGFTLLELLISITVLAVMTGIAFGAFRLGAMAWEKAAGQPEYHHRVRITRNFLERQLAAACGEKISKETNKPIQLIGTPATVSYLSYQPLMPDTFIGIVAVIYRIQEDENGFTLRIYETDGQVLDNLPNLYDVPRQEWRPLIEGADRLYFEYQNSQGEWISSWNQKEKPENPRKVRLAIRPSEKDPVYYAVGRLPDDR